MRGVLELPKPIEKAAANKLAAGRPQFVGFVADADTEQLLQECLPQLGLGRGTIIRGGITKAVEHLSQHRSPNILVVDISGVDLPLTKVNELADVCEPGVTVIAIGDRNEVGLYRDLMHAGVADYLVKPINPQFLSRALARDHTQDGERSPIHKKLGTLVAFVGVRGGVGTTTLAVNTAWYLANRLSRKIALIDLDLQSGDCALTFDIKPSSGLSEALASPLRIDNTLLDRVMTPVGERLFVMSSEEPLEEDLTFTDVAVETLVEVLREQFHFVILDVPRITAAPYRRALALANFRVMVADQTLRSMRDAARLRKILDQSGGAYRNILVINRQGEAGRHAVTLDEIQHVLEMPPKSVIPFQPSLFTAAAGGARIAAAQHSKFTDAIARLVLELSGRPPPRRRWWRAGS
jgi:pilus assembly protein CpaE